MPGIPGKNRVFSAANSCRFATGSRHMTQIARNYARRGWQTGGRHLRDYQRDCARQARFLALECAMCEAAAGVRQRMPPAASMGIPHDGGHSAQSRCDGRTTRRQWADCTPAMGIS